MAAQPNLSVAARLGYAAGGSALIAWGFWGTDGGLARYILPSLGGIVLVEGIIGYCMLCAALGVRKKT